MTYLGFNSTVNITVVLHVFLPYRTSTLFSTENAGKKKATGRGEGGAMGVFQAQRLKESSQSARSKQKKHPWLP